MARTLAILTMSLAGLATMHASSVVINPGNQLNPDGTVSVGMAATSNLTNSLNAADGITGSAFRSQNYLNSTTVLNGNGTPTSALPDSAVVCNLCQSTLFTPTGGPDFYLLGDNTVADKATSTNMWISTSNGTGTPGSISIPVGVFGVTSVATLLNTALGTGTGVQCLTTNAQTCSGTSSYATITLTFDPNNVLTAGDPTETFALINGQTQRNIMDGLGGAYASTLATGGSYTATDIGTDVGTTATVYVKNDYSTGTSTGKTMVLDQQLFPVLSQYQSDWLVAVTITDYGTSSTSHEILSGLTVETPEPGTVLLGLAGFGLMGLVRARRNRA